MLLLFLLLITVFETISLNFIPVNKLNPFLQVEVENGIIQGRQARTKEKNNLFYLYEGIPYAKPPLNNLRFKEPQKAENWSGILDTTKTPISCLPTMPLRFGSEDCLYLSVYTPTNKKIINQKDLLPVMFYIYGGAFQVGFCSPLIYGPDFLIEQYVIIVCTNYRTGIFGFLSTEDLNSPGNYGLKDQLSALQWTHRNIKKFGGDPRRITIFGESAGSVCVQYLMQTTAVRGLIQGAISQSGSSLASWAHRENPRKDAFGVGEALGFKGKSASELLEFLRGVETERLLVAASGVFVKKYMENPYGGFAFGPTVEPEHPQAFLSRRSEDLLKSENFLKVPYIMGVNSLEASIIQDISLPVSVLTDTADKESIVPNDLNVHSNNKSAVADMIKSFYNLTAFNDYNYQKFFSAIFFFLPAYKTANYISKFSKVYFYEFSYEGYNLGKKAVIPTERRVEGVGHAEELWYLWSRIDLNGANETDKLMRSKMIKLWTNFAKFGNPTPIKEQLLENIIWTPFDSQSSYLNINKEMKVRKHWKKKEMHFWDQLYKTWK